MSDETSRTVGSVARLSGVTVRKIAPGLAQYVRDPNVANAARHAAGDQTS